jgi:hypothetical protein
MSNTTTTATATVAEILAQSQAADIARLQAAIDQETNPTYKANRINSLTSQKAYVAAHSQNKYVGSGNVQADGVRVDFVKYFATQAEAQAEIARFPKFVKVGLGTPYHNSPLYRVCLHVSLVSNGITGAVNETAVKRLKRFLQIAGEYVWHNCYLLNYLTNETFQASF